MSWWTKVRDTITNPKNVAATIAAPFTGGASLALLEDNAGNSLMDNITGAKQMKDANAAALEEAERQRQFNAEEAQKNRDWQEQMSNTAITRQVGDLTNAGINPILASQLGGATVGAGSTATGTPAQVQAEPGYGSLASTAASIAGGFSAIGAGVNQMAQAAKTSAETPFVPQKEQAGIANTTADTIQKQAQAQNINANTEVLKETAKQISIDNLTRNDLNKIEIALKTNQSKETLENAIKQALINGYNISTGTNPEQSQIERITNILSTMLYNNFKGKTVQIDKAIQEAISRIIEK